MKTAKAMRHQIEQGFIHPTKGRRKVNNKKQERFMRGKYAWDILFSRGVSING